MEKVNIKKAMKNDASILGFLISSAIFFLIGIAMYFFEDDLQTYVIYLLLGLGALSAIGAISRIFILKNFVSDGRIYKAVIIRRYTYRSTRYIKFEYEVDGMIYKKTNGLFANRNSRDFSKGDEIEILVSDKNPKKALIRDIYFD